MVLRPHHGMAIVVFCEVKFSYDEWLLGFVTGLLGLMWFQMYMFESSAAEIMCFPSDVKHADNWLPELLLPAYNISFHNQMF
ncbi:hypothetical protein HanRHA438_Chr06g0251031 [Helianthus annuus]|nr:hypothetical protein HanRHA438_Chr06g0251031 [Helianthus annuus]